MATEGFFFLHVTSPLVSDLCRKMWHTGNIFRYIHQQIHSIKYNTIQIIQYISFWYFADRASQYIHLNINQLDALHFIISLFHASTCFEHICSSSGGKIVLNSLWYHHTETSEWSKITKITKITKIQFYKYEHIVVQLMCEFFGCDYCVLLTINMLWHVEVMFVWLLKLLKLRCLFTLPI